MLSPWNFTFLAEGINSWNCFTLRSEISDDIALMDGPREDWVRLSVSNWWITSLWSATGSCSSGMTLVCWNRYCGFQFVVVSVHRSVIERVVCIRTLRTSHLWSYAEIHELFESYWRSHHKIMPGRASINGQDRRSPLISWSAWIKSHQIRTAGQSPYTCNTANVSEAPRSV